MSLDKAQAIADGANCAECPLYEKRIVPPRNPGALTAVVGRSPTQGDLVTGEPFSGTSQALVGALLRPYGESLDTVTLTNTVLCRHSQKVPPPAAVKACKPRLVNELANAKRIITCGAESTKALTGLSLTGARGRRHVSPTGQKIVATPLPSTALIDGGVYYSLRDDFRRAFTDPPKWEEPVVHSTEDYATARGYLQALRHYRLLAIDIETTGLSAKSKLVSIGFAFADREAYVIGKDVCRTDAGTELLRAFFTDFHSDSIKGTAIYQNGKFDVKILREAGIPAVVGEDTMYLSFIMDERPGVHSLDYQLQNELEWPYYTPPAVDAGKRNGFTLDHNGEPFTQWNSAYHYNGLDCCGTFQLFPILKARAEQEGVLDRYEKMLIPAATVFADVERRGICFDTEEALRLSQHVVRPRLSQLMDEAAGIIGYPINLGSTQQCAKYLYDTKGLNDPRLNKGAVRSTDDKHREHIVRTCTDADVLAFIGKLSEYKKLDKVRGTYLDGLVHRVDSDGRLRCDLLLHGTETGRLSSRKPNLQNQPRTSDRDIERGTGYVNIRKLYSAGRGSTLIQADYSQVELRTVAVLAQDEFLLDTYAKGKDLHDEMAAFLFGKSFTKQQRVAAKAANFGCLFGIEAWYFGQLFKLPTEEAQRIIDRWWDRVAAVRKWADLQISLMRSQGYVETAFGHRRRFPLLTQENLKHAKRQAVNTPVQGTASDFTTHSIVALHGLLDSTLAGTVLAVHDSAMLECVCNSVTDTANTIKEVMEAQPREKLGWDQIPFSVDLQINERWGDM